MLSVTYTIDNDVVVENYDSVDEFYQKFINSNISIKEMSYTKNSVKEISITESAVNNQIKLDSELFYILEVKHFDKPHGAKLPHSVLNQFFNVEAPKYDSLEQVEVALSTLYKKNNIEFTTQGIKQVVSNYKKRVDLVKQSQKKVEESTLSAKELTKREKVVRGMKKNFAIFKKRYGDKATAIMYVTANELVREDFHIDERELTQDELVKRESIVKSLKKKKKYFQKTYGDRADSVMYAISTKIAKLKE